MDFVQDLSQEQERKIKQIIRLAEACQIDQDHAKQVSWCALRIFDDLQLLHNLNSRERFWLMGSAFLHDIGLHEGVRGHHKTALRIILNTPILKWTNKEKMIVGSVVRYHRKALPDLKHDHFAALDRKERRTVQILAACLRISDGLDFSHQAVIKDIECKVTPKKIKIFCKVEKVPEEEENSAYEKGDLMKLVFDRPIKIEWLLPQEIE
jgi:exopolyphosphatase/pppGpp-phosphohydrolase